jgi:hypothetical protein
MGCSADEERAICYGVKRMECAQIWNKPKNPQTPTPNQTPTQQNTNQMF